MQISEPSLTRMVGKMLENALIERRRMVGDGRAWLVQITPKGREALQAYEVEARALRDHLFSNLPETDLQTTRRVLRGISRRLAD